MKYLKTYQIFETIKTLGLTNKQEEFLNKYTTGTWTYDPATGLVDVDGDFGCYKRRLKTLSGIKFGKVSGNFNVWENSLTSLEGAPQEVGGHFNCSSNRLPSLVGAPQKVSEYFFCANNKLTSLKGAPREVGDHLVCYQNKFTSLEGAPKEVGGAFKCDAFVLGREEWNPKGWAKILREGSPEAKKLIQTLFSAELLNSEIQKDPSGTILKLKWVWNDENFKEIRSKLVWPSGYEDKADLVGDLGGIGF